MCFRHLFPQHRDILEYITHKYSFKQEPQKGIVVTGASANPMRLSPDNFQGTVISHVMTAQVGEKPGVSVEWAKEDVNAIEQNNGHFPSKPGIYYIEVASDETIQQQLTDAEYQNLLSREGSHQYYFYVDPLLKVKKEPVLEITSGDESQAIVMNTPVLEDTIRLFADGQPLTTGYHLELTASESLSITGVPSDEVSLGLPVGNAPSTVKSENQEPFDIQSGTNDTLDMAINGTDVSIPLTTGSLTADEVAADIRNALYGIIPTDRFAVNTEDGHVIIEAHDSIEFSSDSLSTANDELGFEPGFVPVTAKGDIFPSYVEEETILRLTVNGSQEEVPLYTGDKEPSELADFIESKVSGLTAEAKESGDYTFDPDTGEITLHRSFPIGTKIQASYKYPVETRGPFGIDKDHSNNDAIPGVVLAFGRRLSDGDKQAVVIHDSRIPVASEYGGRWEMDVDMDIITRDPQTLEEISDMVLMYFFAIRKEALTEEGLELTDVSFGGEVEEIYDDTSQDYFFNSSVTLSFQTDWAIHIPKPLTIERVTPTSFEEEAQTAGTTTSAESDLIEPEDVDSLNLRRVGEMYLKGRTRDFEKIK